MKLLKLLPLFFIFIISSLIVYAHCPLCTIGAAAVAGGAVYMGINNIAVSVLMGGFAMSMAIWISRLVKKKYIPLQSFLIIAVIFITTIIPLMPIIKGIYPLYISWFGDYGTIFNRTYLLDSLILGSTIGGIIVLISPKLSNLITKLRKDKKIPYQTMILTIGLLILVGVVIQLVVK